MQGMAKSAAKEALLKTKGKGPGGGGGGGEEGGGTDKFGKKIAQGQDPLAALAIAMKLGTSQLKKRPV